MTRSTDLGMSIRRQVYRTALVVSCIRYAKGAGPPQAFRADCQPAQSIVRAAKADRETLRGSLKKTPPNIGGVFSRENAVICGRRLRPSLRPRRGGSARDMRRAP